MIHYQVPLPVLTETDGQPLDVRGPSRSWSGRGVSTQAAPPQERSPSAGSPRLSLSSRCFPACLVQTQCALPSPTVSSWLPSFPARLLLWSQAQAQRSHSLVSLPSSCLLLKWDLPLEQLLGPVLFQKVDALK